MISSSYHSPPWSSRQTRSTDASNVTPATAHHNHPGPKRDPDVCGAVVFNKDPRDNSRFNPGVAVDGPSFGEGMDRVDVDSGTHGLSGFPVG